MQQSTTYFKKIAIISAFAVGVFAFSALADWSTPGTPNSPITPPACPSGDYGCDAPINVSNTSQVKGGGLALCNGQACPSGGLIVVNGPSIFGASTIQDATLKLDVEGAPLKAGGGLIIQTCTVSSNNCPDSNGATPANGRMWLAQ